MLFDRGRRSVSCQTSSLGRSAAVVVHRHALGLSIDALPTQPAVDQLLKGIARATDRRLPAAGSTFLLERSAGRLRIEAAIR
jgi:hypothetical protein